MAAKRDSETQRSVPDKALSTKSPSDARFLSASQSVSFKNDSNAMADADENPSSEDAPETLPASSGDPAFTGGQAQDGVPVEESFAEDVAGAEDFSEKALSKRTRKAYRRAWSDFRQYCDGIGKDPLRRGARGFYIRAAPSGH